MEVKLATCSREETIETGKLIGAKLKGDEVIELRSDVGGGKTTFVVGLAEGAGSDDHVSSPTFTISKLYKCKKKKLEIHHFDFYRLEDGGIMKSEISESLNDDDVCVVVEWADVVEDVLPKERLVIEILSVGEHEREFTFKADEKFSYLISDLKK